MAQGPPAGPSQLAVKLFNGRQPPREFSSLSEREQQTLVEMYKIYVGEAGTTSDRRSRSNGFFLTLHTAAVAGIGAGVVYFAPAQAEWTAVVVGVSCLMGMYMCIVWWRLLKHYQKLNAAKYAVIAEIEKCLPMSPLCAAEWDLLKKGGQFEYVPLTSIEKMVPLGTFVIYLSAFLSAAFLQWHQLVQLVMAAKDFVAGR